VRSGIEGRGRNGRHSTKERLVVEIATFASAETCGKIHGSGEEVAEQGGKMAGGTLRAEWGIRFMNALIVACVSL
jgi:hypothetical protein